MIEGRDSKGHFVKGNMPWNKTPGNKRRENMASLPGKVVGGGVLKRGRVQVICPAYGQQVEAIATDVWVKGYCAVAEQYVDFLIETQRVRIDKHLTAEARAKISAARMGKHRTAETKAKISAALTQRHNKGMLRA